MKRIKQLIYFKQSNPDRVKAPYQLDQFLVDPLFPIEDKNNGFNYSKDDVSVVNIDNKIVIEKGNSIFKY